MYFAFVSCTKGDKCPYLHDKNKLYKGAKSPKDLKRIRQQVQLLSMQESPEFLQELLLRVRQLDQPGCAAIRLRSMRPDLVKPIRQLRPLSKGFGIALVEIMDGINGSVKGSQQGPVQKHVKKTSRKMMS